MVHPFALERESKQLLCEAPTRRTMAIVVEDAYTGRLIARHARTLGTSMSLARCWCLSKSIRARGILNAR
jgi:hypothetical protein